MIVARIVSIALPLVTILGCTGGGGGAVVSSTPPWERFRHDVNNTGQGIGTVEANSRKVTAVPIDGSAIVASPAIALDGSVYIATENGTLAAINPADLTKPKWTVTSCPVCPPESQTLAGLTSSPTIYALSGKTNIFIGSTNGSLLTFADTGTGTPTCDICFRPAKEDFAGAGDVTLLSASFISSPTFSTTASTGNINGIFVGAQVDIQTADGEHRVGKLYAINSDGSIRWQFPRPSEPTIGAVTASPAFGLNDTLYFPAADGNLYSIASNGSLNWAFPIGNVQDPDVPFAPSPMTDTNIFANTADGDIIAIDPQGPSVPPRWRVTPEDLGLSASDGVFATSLALGSPAPTTPTPTPTPNVSPTPPTSPTPTATPLRPTLTVFGVTKSGVVIAIDAATGAAKVLAALPAADGAVLSSPALSGDGFLVFGDSAGNLHSINTVTAQEASGWPVPLNPGASVRLRSSPAIASDGTIYVGADDGMLYVIGK